jgi:hypothetical protein
VGSMAALLLDELQLLSESNFISRVNLTLG